MLGLRLEDTRFYQEANADGRLQEAQFLVFRLLTLRIGSISPILQYQFHSLSLAHIEDLGEALLDFSSTDDLTFWLQHNQN